MTSKEKEEEEEEEEEEGAAGFTLSWKRKKWESESKASLHK